MTNKYLAENESIQGQMLKDKAFICTKTNGLDYKASYDALLLQLEKDIAYKQFLRDVGEDFKFVLHNQNRDELKIEDDMFSYILFNGQAGTKAEYPEYCSKFGITADTFNFPDLKDGYIVSNPISSGEPNGLYIQDSIKAHNHGMQHDHDMRHQHFFNFAGGNNNPEWVSESQRVRWQVSSTYGGRDRTGGSRSNTDNTGSEQTAGRRTTAQIYVKAKFLR